MLTVTPPDAEEALANATYDALMWSMARPGEVRVLPQPGFAAIATTLVDLECKVFAEDAALKGIIAETGAQLVSDAAKADHVFLDEAKADALGRVACGSALYPDEGATVVLAASHRGGPHLRLTGPGIDGEMLVAPALPEGLWAVRAGRCAYPEGFELLVVDGDRVIGIPRSTSVEVL